MGKGVGGVSPRAKSVVQKESKPAASARTAMSTASVGSFMWECIIPNFMSAVSSPKER